MCYVYTHTSYELSTTHGPSSSFKSRDNPLREVLFTVQQREARLREEKEPAPSQTCITATV